jgi:transposase
MDLGQIDEVEVIPPSKPDRRRRFTADEKRKMVEEVSAPGQSISAVARRYGLSPGLLFRWRRLAEAGTMSSLDADEEVVPESEAKALRQPGT